MSVSCSYDQAEIWREYVDDLDSSNNFIAFQTALLDHMRNMAGEAV